MIFLKSFNVDCNLCGASYIIVVCVLSFICSNFCFLFFLFNGKKPKNKNVSVFKPELINAFTKAHAPGTGITFISCSIHFFITISPGSHIPGVPASETNAIFFPSFNSFINSSDFISSLCL